MVVELFVGVSETMEFDFDVLVRTMFLSYMVCIRSSCDVSVAVLVVGSSWSTPV